MNDSPQPDLASRKRSPEFGEDACTAALHQARSRVYDKPDNNNVRLDPRTAFYVRILAENGCLWRGGHLLDVGAGTSWFGPVLAELGVKVTLADDFGGGGGIPDVGPKIKSVIDEAHRLINSYESTLGLRVLRQDVLTQPLPLESSSVDVITSFNSLEHWHHSPKRLFKELVRVLRPGGRILIATPNAANARKRISALLGANVFDRLEWWYEDGDPVFRGHVREPIVRDLQQILKWNGFEVQRTWGRNFIGRDSIALSFLPLGIRSALAGMAELFLTPFPTLCSDILVLGRKPK